MQEYLDAIRNRVCTVCLDAVMHGDQFVRCGIPKGRTCPVEIFLPQVVLLARRGGSSVSGKNLGPV